LTAASVCGRPASDGCPSLGVPRVCSQFSSKWTHWVISRNCGRKSLSRQTGPSLRRHIREFATWLERPLHLWIAFLDLYRPGRLLMRWDTSRAPFALGEEICCTILDMFLAPACPLIGIMVVEEYLTKMNWPVEVADDDTLNLYQTSSPFSTGFEHRIMQEAADVRKIRRIFYNNSVNFCFIGDHQ